MQVRPDGVDGDERRGNREGPTWEIRFHSTRYYRRLRVAASAVRSGHCRTISRPSRLRFRSPEKLAVSQKCSHLFAVFLISVGTSCCSCQSLEFCEYCVCASKRKQQKTHVFWTNIEKNKTCRETDNNNNNNNNNNYYYYYNGNVLQFLSEVCRLLAETSM